jgi:hypothetical protein
MQASQALLGSAHTYAEGVQRRAMNPKKAAKQRAMDERLRKASGKGLVDDVLRFIEEGADVNATATAQNDRAFKMAWAMPLRLRDVPKLSVRCLHDRYLALIEEGPANALDAASVNGHEDLVNLLIGRGAYVNAQNGSALEASSAKGTRRSSVFLSKRGPTLIRAGNWAAQCRRHRWAATSASFDSSSGTALMMRSRWEALFGRHRQKGITVPFVSFSREGPM